MGALHAGHRALMDAATKHCDTVIASLFVNPAQFGPHEDYENYPRNLDADIDFCRQAGVDLVFAPGAAEIYPPGSVTSIHVGELADGLCAVHRPGHFDGVAIVVAKLFNIVTPDAAFFGEKDYQQLKVIQQLTRDLNLPIEIVPCPTVRESDGLAISSRNAYLQPSERRQATSLHQALMDASRAIRSGQRDVSALQKLIRNTIERAGPANIEYISVVDADSLVPLSRVDRSARICLAVHIGHCRLIDNVGIDAGELTE